MVSILASGPSCPGFDSQCSQIFFKEVSIVSVGEVINSTAKMKVDSGLKFFIEPI